MNIANQQLIESIQKSVIGEGLLFDTPFGERPLIYADYTASGRSLSFIEDFIRDQILPFYANTHTESSATGHQTTVYREQARQLIKHSINASDDHLVIFCGSGATGAIHKLIEILNLRLPTDLGEKYALMKKIPNEQRPVVFIGPYEHHSNELPWRESIADLVTIQLNAEGQIDQQQLELQLQRYSHRSIKIGSFSAASNVTGLLSDVDSISCLLHEYGALAFWDYAAAAPYVGINVQSHHGCASDSSKDAIFISPHKFVGGPGTPGLLVVKRSLLKNKVPSTPGGGTVSFVTPTSHTYLPVSERREEGGTPAIIESIRAGLVFQLKDAVGASEIEKREQQFIKRAFHRWKNNANIHILGSLQSPRTAIVSLQICRNGKPLHYGFLAVLLNDLFGIQVRGGCACAGPYGHTLLGLNHDKSFELQQAIDQGFTILRPGWVRLNFNYFLDEETFNYLITAIELVAKYGWKLLTHYHYDQKRGVWCHHHHKSTVKLHNLHELSVFQHAINKPRNRTQALSFYLKEAELIMQERANVVPVEKWPSPPFVENLRWFYLPQDAI